MLNDNRWLTIPNLLSVSRVALLPLWWWLMSSDEPSHRAWGAVLIIYGIASDAADGWIARHLNQASAWGRVFDPVGDKIAALVVGLFCVLHRGLPAIPFALTILRDVALVAGGVLVYRRTNIMPVSANLGRYAALLWGIVLLLYAFDLQPYARYTVWPVVATYLIAGVFYVRVLFAPVASPRK